MKLRGPSAADTAKSQSGLNANSTEGRKDREDSRTKVEPAETVATVHHRNESGLNEENQVGIFSTIRWTLLFLIVGIKIRHPEPSGRRSMQTIECSAALNPKH